MPWATVAIAGISLIGGMRKKKKAKKAAAAERGAQQEQINLGKEELAFGKEQYADWKSRFDPMYSKMVNEMDQDITPDYGMIAGDVKSSFQAARDAERRQAMRYGNSPRDGSMEASDRAYGIAESTAHVGARARAREDAKGTLYERLSGTTGMLGNMQSGAMGAVQQGFDANRGAYGEMADTIGDQANDSYNRSGQELGDALGAVDWKGIAESVRRPRGVSA